MKKPYFFIIVACFLSIGSLHAWDEVSHAFITNLAIEKISDLELKKLLQNHREYFIYGSWYTDTYQYTENRFEKLNPHILQIHYKAFLPYLQKPEVKSQDNYNQLLAVYLGSVAHSIEDFWLDYILYSYPSEIQGDKITGDTYNGVINIILHQYLTLEVKNHLPLEDLHNLYREAELLDESMYEKKAFFSMLNSWSNKQYLMLRSLKLLSFLASNQVINESPWTAANMLDAPGGIMSCAEKAAMVVEATWNNIQKKPVEGILEAEYIWIDNSLALITSFPVAAEKFSRQNSFVINQKGDTIYGRIEQMKYAESNLNRTNLVLKFFPDIDFVENESYSFYLLPGKYGHLNDIELDQTFQSSFTAKVDHAMIANKADSLPMYMTFGTGFFLFVLCFGISGIFIGSSGIISFLISKTNNVVHLPILVVLTKRILEGIGITILLFGLYLFITRGWLVIMNV